MRRFSILLLTVFLVSLSASLALATNGDNLIGVGAISRSMGGTGIAAPQDAISAVFANPAAMCFGPYCPGSEVDFSGTLFMPHVSAKINVGGTTFKADSDNKVYAIPAIGISVPIEKNLRFGIAAYGVSGLGVDYRDTNIDQPHYYDFSAAFGLPPGTVTKPLAAGTVTQLQIMKFSPSIAYQPSKNFSLGLGLHIDYSSLDLGEGSNFNYGYGAQIGAIVMPTEGFYIGAIYLTPQNVDHQNVTDFDGDGRKDDLELESPQQAGLGIAIEPVPGTLLFEGDVRWVNWADAKGYKEFDWEDQWVFAVGAQFKPTKDLAFRVGYNYGKNPVKEHNNFNGTVPSRDIQGKTLPANYFYETFRIIGFPAIVENHVTAGIGYKLSKAFSLDLGYKHAFENKISEKGTDPFGTPVTLESKLSEDAVDFQLVWNFPSM